MKKFKPLFIIATALQLAPLTALAQEAHEAELHFLSREEAKELIEGFDVAKEGKDPASKVQIFGRIFSECVAEFQFQAVPHASGQVGLSLVDRDGKGQACIKEKQAKKERCTNSTCTRLSTLGIAEFDLAALAKGTGKDGEIAVTWYVETGPDRRVGTHEDLGITYKSAATLKREREEALAKAREEKETRLRGIIASCKTRDPLEAMGALQQLCGMGACKHGEFEKVKREIALGELAVINRKVKAKDTPVDELEGLREQLNAWAAANPDQVARAATVYREIARRYAAAKAFEQAEDTIEEALELEGIDGAEKGDALFAARQELQTDVDSLKTAKFETLVNTYGWQSNWAAQQQFGQLMWQRQQAYYRACMPRDDGSVDADACGTASTALQQTAQLPQLGMQADFRFATQAYQRCLASEQMNRQMQQMMGAATQAQPMQQGSMCGPAPQMPGAPGLGIGGAPGAGNPLAGAQQPIMPYANPQFSGGMAPMGGQMPMMGNPQFAPQGGMNPQLGQRPMQPNTMGPFAANPMGQLGPIF